MDLQIDEKLYYKIGEVAKIIDIKPYVIRYWEKEFRFLKPYKSKSFHRLYSKAQIERLLVIKDYLYNQKYTIEGARNALKHSSAEFKHGSGDIKPASQPRHQSLSVNTESISAALSELKMIKSILIDRKLK